MADSSLLIISLFGYFALQAWTVIVWQGWWRFAALVPLVVFAGLLVQAAIAYGHGSNLWPIMLIFFGPLGLVVLGILALVRRLTSGGGAS